MQEKRLQVVLIVQTAFSSECLDFFLIIAKSARFEVQKEVPGRSILHSQLAELCSLTQLLL